MYGLSRKRSDGRMDYIVFWPLPGSDSVRVIGNTTDQSLRDWDLQDVNRARFTYRDMQRRGWTPDPRLDGSVVYHGPIPARD